MEIIYDKEKLQYYYNGQKSYFQQKPPTMMLVKFQRGELLSGPMHRLKQFYILVQGCVSIYDLTENGEIRYLSRSGIGTLLGDVEFSGMEQRPLYTEAAEDVLCLSLPFCDNLNVLENDPVFLRFALQQLAKKLSFSALMTVSAQTLEEKLLFYLRNIQPKQEITSVNDSLQVLQCSRRQLQRVLKKLCDEGALQKEGRGHYIAVRTDKTLTYPLSF